MYTRVSTELSVSVLVCCAARAWRLAFTVVVREAPQRRLEVRGGLLLDLVRERVDLEAVQPRYKLGGRALGARLRVHHEHHMREPGAEVGAVGVVVARGLGGVHLHAARTVQLHHRLARHVR